MSLDLLIPVYNQASSIQATIESALSQVAPYNSIIISDNWSTDGTSEILSKYSGKLHIIKPPSHLSMVANWNFLAACSSSRWISFCSGDDLVAKDHSACFSEVISTNPRQSFLAAGFNQVNNVKNALTEKRLLSAHFLVSDKSLHHRLLTKPLASFAAFCIRKAFFDDIGGYNQNYKVNMDWIMQLSASKHSGIKRIHKVLASYFINDRPYLSSSRQKAFHDDIKYYIGNDLPYFANYQSSVIERAVKSLQKKGWA